MTLLNHRKNAGRGQAFQLAMQEKLGGGRSLDVSQGTKASLEKKEQKGGRRRCYRFADLHACDLRRAKEFSLTYPEERKIGF